MGRIYTVCMAAVAITAANTDVDWLEVLPADDKPVKLRGWIISQTSQVGDSLEAMLRFRVIHLPATVTSGSGGAALTTNYVPSPPDSADVAVGFTAEAGNTTVATSSGTFLVKGEFGWNIRNAPFEFWYPDERFCPKVKQGEGLVVRQETTVGVTTTCAATFWLEEE